MAEITRQNVWGSNVDTATLSHSISAGANRFLIVGIVSEGDQTTHASVDYGGEAMVKITEQETGAGTSEGHTSIWYLKDADIATAATSIITPTFGGTAPASYGISALCYLNVDQVNPIAQFDGDFSTAATPNPITTIDLQEVTVGNAVVGVSMNGLTGTASWHSDLTEQVDTEGSSLVFAVADALIGGAPAGDIQVECTFTNQNRRADVSIEIAQSASAYSQGIVIA